MSMLGKAGPAKDALCLVRQGKGEKYESDIDDPEIMKTGLWISNPKGPIVPASLS